MFKAGSTFLLSKPRSSIYHLWVLVTDPEPDGRAVMVSFTTLRAHSDTTVVLRRGDHPFIKHETVVQYCDAAFVNAITGLPLLLKGDWGRPSEDVSEGVLRVIQQGLLRSQRTPEKFKTYCRNRYATTGQSPKPAE